MLAETKGGVRTADLLLPASKEGLLDVLRTVLDLTNVTEVVINTKRISVSRWMSDDGPVIPKELPEVDADFLFARIAENLVHDDFDPEKHPFVVIRDVMSRITRLDLRPNWVFAHPGMIEAYLDLPEVPPSRHVFGMKIMPIDDPEYADKLVVVGSSTAFLSDASIGVVVDIGI